MPLTERTPKVNQGEVRPKVNSTIKEIPINNDISEIRGKVEMPVSWDSACRL